MSVPTAMSVPSGAGEPAHNGGSGSLSSSVGGTGGNGGGAGGNGRSIGHEQTGQDESSAGERLVPEPRY